LAGNDWLMVLDFDGTITTEDASEAMLAAFADPSWIEIDLSYARGEIGVAELMNREYALVRVGQIELRDFVLGRIEVRPRFREFADWAKGQGIELVLLSAGLDFYIEAVLEHEGIGGYFTRAYYLQTEFGPEGIRCRLPSLKRPLEPLADYKRAVVEELRERGRRIAYAGDGDTDRLAAEASDLVFARRKLAAHFRGAGRPFVPFESFDEVLQAMREHTAGPPIG
jgi:2-hydroxy-3-keto-5-methylthiopentenyl-1-phosphate phosphatase